MMTREKLGSVYVGSDPGKEGFIAWLSSGGTPLGSAPQPVIGKGKGDTLDRHGMVRLVKTIREHGPIALWAIEQQMPVGGAGRMNPVSIGMQMKGYGIWLGVLAALDVPMTEVKPAYWRTANGVALIKADQVARLAPLPKGATKEEKKEHAKQKRQRADKARKATLLAAVAAAQRLFPTVDFRATEKSSVPSPDKAAAFLLARAACMGGLQVEALSA